MKNGLLKLLFLLIASVVYGLTSYSQATKSPAKKSAVTVNSKSPATNHPVVKSYQPAKLHPAKTAKNKILKHNFFNM